jgi:hypothetical protein
MSGIQASRGCRIRFHPSGYRVVMYYDSPGQFFNESGKPVGEEVAAQAGYDVEELGRERKKRERIEELRRKAEAEFATVEQKVEKELSASSTGGMVVKHVGGGKYAVFDSEGVRLTKRGLTKEEAELLASDEGG